MKGLGWKHAVLVVASVLLVALAVQATGVGPAEALRSFFQGSMGGPGPWRKTLREMTPLLLAGLAVFVALRAGLFNIGADGQLSIGAMATAAVGLVVPGPAGILLGVIAGIVAGALWAFPVAWIKAYRNGHEVITSIMLNNVAAAFTLALVKGPLKDPAQETATTAVLEPGLSLPELVSAPPFRLNLSLALAALLVLAVYYWFRTTVAGFELSATGANATAALSAGINVKRMQLRALCVSGGLSGLTGAFMVLGYEHRFYQNFSPGYGFDALGVALLSGSNALGLFPSAFVFAVMASGTTAVQALGIPKGLSGVLLGLTILVFAAIRYGRQVRTHE